MNEIHNHSTFRQFYDEFHSIFLNSFCTNRRKNVKKRLFSEMQTGQEHKKIVVCAYSTICHDSKIVEKALKYYRRMESIK